MGVIFFSCQSSFDSLCSDSEKSQTRILIGVMSLFSAFLDLLISSLALFNNSKFYLFLTIQPSSAGGKIFHASVELRTQPRYRHRISHVLCAMGTNDASEGETVLQQIHLRITKLVRAVKAVYSEAQVKPFIIR